MLKIYFFSSFLMISSFIWIFHSIFHSSLINFEFSSLAFSSSLLILFRSVFNIDFSLLCSSSLESCSKSCSFNLSTSFSKFFICLESSIFSDSSVFLLYSNSFKPNSRTSFVSFLIVNQASQRLFLIESVIFKTTS